MKSEITLTPQLLRAVAAALPTRLTKEYAEGGRWEEYEVEHSAAASLRALATELEYISEDEDKCWGAKLSESQCDELEAYLDTLN